MFSFIISVMGCDSSKLWVPGLKPDQSGRPQKEEDYSEKGIREAYKEADSYVTKDPKRRFCTIGPQCSLKCWEVAELTKKTTFTTVNDNVVLRFQWKELKVDDKTQKICDDYKWGLLYF